MADISVANGTRPKSVQENSLAVPLLVPNPIKDDVNDRAVYYVQYENLPPVPATIEITENITTTSGNAVLTIAGATFTYNGVAGDYDVRIGDGVAGTGIGVSAKVLSINSATQITLDTNSTASGTINDLVITPPTYDANLLAVVLDSTQSKSVLSIRVRVFRSDGSTNIDSDGDGADDSTYLDYGTALVDKKVDINLDTVLTNQRNNRTT